MSPVVAEGGAAKLVKYLVSGRPGVPRFESVGNEPAEVAGCLLLLILADEVPEVLAGVAVLA